MIKLCYGCSQTGLPIRLAEFESSKMLFSSSFISNFPHSGPRRSCYSSHGLKIKKIPSCAALVDAGLISIAWVWNSLTWTCWLGKKLIFDALRHFPQMRLKVLLVSLKLHLMQNVCSMLCLLPACHSNSSLNFLSKYSRIHVKRS